MVLSVINALSFAPFTERSFVGSPTCVIIEPSRDVARAFKVPSLLHHSRGVDHLRDPGPHPGKDSWCGPGVMGEKLYKSGKQVYWNDGYKRRQGPAAVIRLLCMARQTVQHC